MLHSSSPLREGSLFALNLWIAILFSRGDLALFSHTIKVEGAQKQQFVRLVGDAHLDQANGPAAVQDPCTGAFAARRNCTLACWVT